MLSRKFLAFLLLIKMVTSQSVYPTTAVSYSTNSVPTVQTLPVSTTSATVSAVPTVIAPTKPATMPSTVTVTAVPTSGFSAASVASTPMPATCVTATPMPATCVAATPLSSTPTVSLTSVPSSVPKVTSMTTSEKEPKAYFLPANIPDPKVTILASDKPSFVEVKPRVYEEPGYVDVKATLCPDLSPRIRRGNGPMTPAKRVTMACTDEVPTFLNEQPVCPGISKMDIAPPPSVMKDKESLKNPIDFEGLLDSFMTCL